MSQNDDRVPDANPNQRPPGAQLQDLLGVEERCAAMYYAIGSTRRRCRCEARETSRR